MNNFLDLVLFVKSKNCVLVVLYVNNFCMFGLLLGVSYNFYKFENFLYIIYFLLSEYFNLDDLNFKLEF